MNEDPEEDANVQAGSIFSSAKELQQRLQTLANTHKFKVRLEKNAVVCVNAEQSNWTAVCDSTTRAQQAWRKIKKNQDQGVTLVDDSLEDNIDDILQTEIDKASTRLCFQSFRVHYNFSPTLFLIGKVQEETSQEFNTLWLYVARPLQKETRQKWWLHWDHRSSYGTYQRLCSVAEIIATAGS
jgi:hypothetical protein